MEPTNNELMVHLIYIRDTVDELKAATREATNQVNEHETRLTILEQRTPKRSSMWGAIGGLVGGFLSSLLSSGKL